MKLFIKGYDIKAKVSSVEADSCQNEQPVGWDETFNGALNRARVAKAHDSSKIAVGIESGIFRFGGKHRITLDIAVIVLLLPDGRMIVSSSDGIQFPDEFVKNAEKRGFEKNTVGSVIKEKLGGFADDPHMKVSNGKKTRIWSLVEGLATAFSQV